MFENYGIGVDIEEISRFKNINFNQNINFYEKIFTEAEIKYCLGKKNPYQHFAVRFCAKEAFIKASKKKIKDYKVIEIITEADKPFIIYNGIKSRLSMSHDKTKAIAMVVVQE